MIVAAFHAVIGGEEASDFWSMKTEIAE